MEFLMTLRRAIGTTVIVLIVAAGFGCGKLDNSRWYHGEGTLDGRVTVGGNPVGGALVFALGEPERKTTTIAGGTFNLTASAGLDRQLVAMWGSDLGLRTSFSLADKGILPVGDIQLVPTGIVAGTVDLGPGREPWEAEVWVVGTPFVTHPDRWGDYQFTLPEGEWTLEISAVGHEDLRIDDVLVESGTTRQVDPATPPDDPDYTCTGTETKTERFTQGGGGGLDILFILDNSGSMVGEQAALAESFDRLVSYLVEGEVDYHIAVVTTGMESTGCPACDEIIEDACINSTGETGRFQDRICRNQGDEQNPDYVCESDPSCRTVDSSNWSCFYDQVDKGTVFVGVKGCGFERGLAAMSSALDNNLLGSYNQGFLREAARLAVIVVSDEDDCGEVGDVYELSGDGGNICYFAAKGEGPEPDNPVYNPMTYHLDDPEQRPYQLKPVDEYAQFLLGVKNNQRRLVKFAAVVGVNPNGTDIQYEWTGTHWDVVNACTTPGCTGDYCYAKPGTRYIELAELLDGSVESICQTDFAEPMVRIAGASTGYLRIFPLSYPPASPDTIKVWVDDDEKDTSEWSWDPTKQAVVFAAAFAPSSYSLIKVEYQTNCQ
jgi:hypothetical protein